MEEQATLYHKNDEFIMSIPDESSPGCLIGGILVVHVQYFADNPPPQLARDLIKMITLWE